MLLKRAYKLVLIILSGVTLVVPMSAQSFEAAKAETGCVRGTVVDSSDDPIPAATVVLQGPAGDRLTAVTKDDGTFTFNQAYAEVAYQVTVTAEGFADWSSSITVESWQDKTLADVRLRILAVQRAVTVNYSSKDVAVQQLKAEEQQRVLGFIPNVYVVYEPHPEPLTTKMRFQLAYKISPIRFSSPARPRGLASNRPVTTLVNGGKVRKDMASGWGLA